MGTASAVAAGDDQGDGGATLLLPCALWRYAVAVDGVTALETKKYASRASGLPAPTPSRTD